MNKIQLLALLIALPLPNTGCACEKINAGNVGIEVKLAGKTTGVQDIPFVTGWIWYNPFITDIVEYPTFVQTAKWEGDEAIRFNSAEGLAIGCEVSFSYSIIAEKAPNFYVTFRSDDLERFTHGYLHNVTRDAFNEVGSQYPVEDIYGPKKELFVKAVTERVNSKISSVGVRITQLGVMGQLQLPANVVNQINASIAATQSAVRVENELRQTRAEAAKNVAQAEGDAKVAIAQAEGSSKARQARAEGEAAANQVLTKSLSPELLKWRNTELVAAAIARWDGRRPTIEGGSGQGLLLQLPEHK